MTRHPAPSFRSSLREVSQEWRGLIADAEGSEPSGDLLLATNVIDWPGTQVWERHEHDDPELLWNVAGRVRVETPAGLYVVPTGVNLWIPAGVPHEVTAPDDTTLSCTWFSPDHCPVPWTEPSIFGMSPLLHQVLTHLDDFTLPAEARRRAEAFAFDLLVPTPAIAFGVPMPTSGELRRVADLVLADPADRRDLDAWARLAHLGVRTFTRRFLAETDTTFGQWRRRVQIQQATTLLAEGHSIQATAAAVGYHSTSAFVASFARVVGVTPGAYRDRHR